MKKGEQAVHVFAEADKAVNAAKVGGKVEVGGAKGSAFAGRNIDDLSNAGKLLDPADKSGQLSLAGRALQKHGSREGSAFPSVKGSPSEINVQGKK
ncbi:hypothetical protein [Achromobacter marplatensis]|uniref:hypothetical protein n=1 Tax=Achromobacter marplatensis TaxID=470868 RepID=UPI0039F6E809